MQYMNRSDWSDDWLIVRSGINNLTKQQAQYDTLEDGFQRGTLKQMTAVGAHITQDIWLFSIYLFSFVSICFHWMLIERDCLIIQSELSFT